MFNKPDFDNSDTIRQLHDKISRGEILSALLEIRQSALSLSAFPLADQARLATDDYRRMLDFFVSDAVDNEQHDFLFQLKQRAHRLTETLREELAVADNTSASARERQIAEVRHRHLLLSPPDDDTESWLLSLAYSVDAKLMSQSEADTLFSDFILNTDLPLAQRALVLSTAIHNLLSRFDHHLFLLLTEAAKSDEEVIKARAVVGIMASMIVDHDRWTGGEEDALLSYLNAAVESDPSLPKFLRSAFRSLIQTLMTDAIAKFVSNDIEKEIRKMARRLLSGDKPLSGQHTIIIEQQDLEELFGKGSKTVSKFEKLATWQMNGADIAFNSYRHLKDDDFFNNPVNWLRPFDTSATQLQDCLRRFDDSTASELVSVSEETLSFCDSDKYSMIFGLDNISSSDRETLKNHFLREVKQLNEHVLNDDSLPAHVSRLNMRINGFVHDLYRFWRLRSEDFGVDALFRSESFIDFIKSELFLLIYPTPADIDTLGSFLVDCDLWQEALTTYSLKAQGEMAGDANWLCKYALCLIHCGNIDDALFFLKRADLIDDANSWIKVKIAECSFEKEDYAATLYYIDEAAKLRRLSDKMRFIAASAAYFSADYHSAIESLDGINGPLADDASVARLRAQAFLMLGSPADAQEAYDTIPDDEKSQDDHYMLMAIALFRDEHSSAVAVASRFSIENLKDLSQDAHKRLAAINVDPMDMSVAIDAAALSRLSSKEF
ncbi:MAG: hypothetical protein II951_12040 [Bacteroidales bacterium]|nr:hypothetical protein [Bacteroidales bacterium]